MPLKVEWDNKKAAANLAKHGVAFEEASSVLGDPLAVIFDDDEHSQNEPREIIIGHSCGQRLLLVSFTEREEGIVRIISARKTTGRERSDYEQGIHR